MSYDGIYNLLLNGGSATANSPAVSTFGVDLTGIDTNNPRQKWSIRPIGGVEDNAYTIQSAYTGIYVAPAGETVTYSLNPYAWFISGANGLIQNNPGDSALNWSAGEDGKIVLSTDTNARWSIF